MKKVYEITLTLPSIDAPKTVFYASNMRIAKILASYHRGDMPIIRELSKEERGKIDPSDVATW
jgi:hypothetical protein